MSTSSKYIVYQCSICKRQTEILLNARSPDPVRCNITLHCRGLLSKVGERTQKGFLFTPIVPGLDDYIPRGQSLTITPAVKPLNPITIFTGLGIVTAACFRRQVDENNNVTFFTIDIGGSEFIVETPVIKNAPAPINSRLVISVFEITPSLLQFKRYTYNVGAGTQLIRGIDNSPEGKNLRFDDSNQIKVILNGVELSASDYDRSVVNQITMTPVITVPSSILEILVWDEVPSIVPLTDLIELSFKPLASSGLDLSVRSNICWGDYNAADFTLIENPSAPLILPDDQKSIRSLLYCLDLSDLDNTKSYGIAKVEAESASKLRTQISSDEFYLVLGTAPFLFQDKLLRAFVPGTKLMNQSSSLSFQRSESTGEFELVVDQEIITQKYYPIDPVMPVTFSEPLTSTGATTPQSGEELKPKYILGPS